MLNQTYNPKIDYLMCKWLANPRKNHNEFVLRKVFDNELSPITKEQYRVCRYRDTFSYFVQAGDPFIGVSMIIIGELLGDLLGMGLQKMSTSSWLNLKRGFVK